MAGCRFTASADQLFQDVHHDIRKWMLAPTATLEEAQSALPEGNIPLTKPLALGLPEGCITYAERYAAYHNMRTDS